MITVKLDEDIDRSALQDVLDADDERLLSRLPLEELFENMQASGRKEEWKQSLKFLTDQWLADIEFFSRAGSLGERQEIPDRDSRDRLETLARVHDTITATLERLEA
jgi:hypothetical protein